MASKEKDIVQIEKATRGRAQVRNKAKVDEVINRPYYLNVQKSLAKKLEATKRNSVEYRHTDGGVTGQADAVTFELMKEALLVYFGNEKRDFKCKITESKDKDGNCVQKTIRVLYPNQTDSYTVNMYYTKCSFLVNGRSVDRFLQEDLKKLHTVIESAKVDGKAVDIAELNKILAKQLSGVLNLNSQQSNTPAIKETDNVESSKCIKCEKYCHKRAAFCENTLHWIHYRCDKLSVETIQKIENDPTYKYECQVCVEAETDKVNVKAHCGGSLVLAVREKVTEMDWQIVDC